MKLNDKNYPYPILVAGSDDYCNCSFNIEIVDEPKEVNDNIVIELLYNLECHSLEKFIESKKITVIAQVLSKSTSYRKYYTFIKNRLNLSIDKSLLGSKVEINTYLTALEKIDNFILPEHNKLYFSFPMTIQKGDKLGFAETLTFDLKPYDALRPVASVVSIKVDNRKEALPVDVDLTNDKIIIYLNSSLYEKYRELRQFPDIRLYLSNTIVMPAVIEALYEIKNNPDLDRNKRWTTSIERVLKKMNIDLYSTEYSCYAIANLIFKNGIEVALASLEKFYNIENKEQI